MRESTKKALSKVLSGLLYLHIFHLLIIAFFFLVGAIPWSAIAFLLFVSILLILSIILILYFEKLCCFARYRFLKHLLRRITRTKKTKTPSTTTQSVPLTHGNNFEDNEKVSPKIQEYLWIAGQCEHITTFQPTTSIFTNESSM